MATGGERTPLALRSVEAAVRRVSKKKKRRFLLPPPRHRAQERALRGVRGRTVGNMPAVSGKEVSCRLQAAPFLREPTRLTVGTATGQLAAGNPEIQQANIMPQREAPRGPPATGSSGLEPPVLDSGRPPEIAGKRSSGPSPIACAFSAGSISSPQPADRLQENCLPGRFPAHPRDR